MLIWPYNRPGRLSSLPLWYRRWLAYLWQAGIHNRSPERDDHKGKRLNSDLTIKIFLRKAAPDTHRRLLLLHRQRLVLLHSVVVLHPPICRLHF